MKEIEGLLKIVSDGLKMVAQGLEVLAEKVEEVAESQNLAQPKAKTRRSPAPKQKAASQTSGKASAKGKVAKAPTAAETVLNLVIGSDKGVNVATIMDKTGYDRQKIANIVYRLAKQGKIKSVQRGVYVKA